jgi:hypothetical protein
MVPGFLVALKTSVRGGVEYFRSDIERSEEGHVKEWHTKRLMEDPDERREATETINRLSNTIARLCTRTTFGLLCRTDREEELDEAIRDVRREVSEWNAQAVHSSIHINAVKGRIADNDEEAIRAIVDEATELLDRMEKGLSEADIKVIRDAAGRAKKLSGMLTPEAAGRLESAIESARDAARVIVKKAGDLDARVADAMIQVESEAFSKARFTFLEAAEHSVEALPSVDLSRGAALEVV